MAQWDGFILGIESTANSTADAGTMKRSTK